MTMFLPACAAKQRPMMPPQTPTPMSVLQVLDCPFTMRPYRIFMVAGQPLFTLHDMPLAMRQRVHSPTGDHFMILDGTRWLEVVPESMAYAAIRRAFPEPDHPFRAWHGDKVRATVEHWRFEEAA